MSFIMKIIFATEPIKYPLTGIGRYSLELVKRLAVAREIEELKLFHGASFIEQIPLVENKSDTKNQQSWSSVGVSTPTDAVD